MRAARSLSAAGVMVVAGSALALIAGSGGASTPPVPSGPAPAPTASLSACAAPVASTVGHIGQNTYANDQRGLNSVYSRYRVGNSTALGDAVARGDAAGATGIMKRLLFHQISRLQVYRGSSLLAQLGRSPALAPVRGRLRDSTGRVVGRFVLAIQNDSGFAALTGSTAGTTVLVREGAHQVAGSLVPGPAAIPDRGSVSYHGVTYAAYSFTGTAFTGKPVRVSYLVPPAGVAEECGSSAQSTVLNTIAGQAVGIYKGELLSATTRAGARTIAQAPDMLSAVTHSSPAGVGAAIVRLFRTRLHVVRIRVTGVDGRLIKDIGGPAVLAPVGGDFRGAAGRVIGHFVFSLQDDAGYIKLVRNFTGAKVLMRVRGRQVAGTLSPGPPNPPDYGPVWYRGVRYYCYSFPAAAFPADPLRISILVRPELYL